MNRAKRDYCSKGLHPNWRVWTYEDIGNKRLNYAGSEETYHQILCKYCRVPLTSKLGKGMPYQPKKHFQEGNKKLSKKEMVFNNAKLLKQEHSYTSQQSLALSLAYWSLEHERSKINLNFYYRRFESTFPKGNSDEH